MKKAPLLLITSLVCFTFCKEKNRLPYVDENNTIVVEIDHLSTNTGVIFASEFVDSISLIKLEATDESLISIITNVLINGDLIFVHDKKTKSVLVFNKNGKYINRIAKVGQGPGEYTKIDHVLIDNNNKQMMVYDGGMRKMVFYTFDGSFIDEINNFSAGMVMRDVINMSNGNFLCYCNDKLDGQEFTLWEVDSAGKFIKGLLKYEDSYPFYLNENSSYLYRISDSKIGLMDTNLNSIYHYENNTLSKYLSYTLNAPSSSDFPNMTLNKLNFHRLLNTYEKTNYILTEWTDDKMNSFVSLYSKQENKVTTAQSMHYSTDINGVWGRIVDVNQPNVIVVVITPDIMMYDLESKSIPEEVKTKLRNILSNMTEMEIEDMNPVLEFLYVKQ